MLRKDTKYKSATPIKLNNVLPLGP